MELEIIPKYSFVFLSEGAYSEFCNRNIQELLRKWGIDFQFQHYLFNEPFHQYYKYHLAEAFFKNQKVLKNLKEWINKTSTVVGIMVPHIDKNEIPCSITSMSFFDKLKNPKHNIINHLGRLCQRLDTQINGISVTNNLRAMILDKECNEFSLYSTDERSEFIFHIFQMLVLGGEYCQYEDDLESYLKVTKTVYRDLVSIRKHEDNNAFISTIVLRIVAKIDTLELPEYPDCMRNIGFLLIDRSRRKVTSFLHQFLK